MDPRVRPVPVGADVVVVSEKGVAEAAGFPKPRLNPVEAAVELVRLPKVRPVVDAAAPEAGVLKVNPVAGFCANTLDPNPGVEVVLVAAGVDVGAPNPPNANPPVPAAGVLVAAPNENPPPVPVPVDPRVLVPKLKLDILELNFRNLTIRNKQDQPRGGPKATSYDIRWIIKAATMIF